MEQVKAKTVLILIVVLVAILAAFLLFHRSQQIAPQEPRTVIPANPVHDRQVHETILERRKQRAQEDKMKEDYLLQFDSPLDTESERQSFYDQLLQISSEKLYTAWISSLDSTKGRHRGLLEMALAGRLKLEKDSPENKGVYEQAAEFLLSPESNESNKIRMLKWLGQSGTPTALGIFLTALDSATGELRVELYKQIAQVGNSRWDHKDSERLSAQLESKWNKLSATGQTDMRALGPLAQALARVGSPDGIRLLLNEVTLGQAAQPSETVLLRANAALIAFREIRDNSGVSILAAGISNQPSDSTVLLASGDGLAAMGDVQATQFLIDWALNAGDESAVTAERFFSQLWHPATIELVRHLLEGDQRFSSSAVRKAVQRAVTRQ